MSIALGELLSSKRAMILPMQIIDSKLHIVLESDLTSTRLVIAKIIECAFHIVLNSLIMSKRGKTLFTAKENRRHKGFQTVTIAILHY